MSPQFELDHSGWDKVFRKAAKADHSKLRIVCPFLKEEAVRRLLDGMKPDAIEVITRFHLGEMCEGVNDISALNLLLEHDAKIRGIQHLHAKLYLFGDSKVIVTSANLTEAALKRNHEFGFVSNDESVIGSCHDYFQDLWERAGKENELTPRRLSGWEKQIKARCVPRVKGSGLGDEGTFVPQDELKNGKQIAKANNPQAIVKFLGESKGDMCCEHNFAIFEEVNNSWCHRAVVYPNRSTITVHGDTIFLGRFVRNPSDLIIFGRAIRNENAAGRDDDLEKKMPVIVMRRYPHPVLVHLDRVELLSGTLENGVSRNELRQDGGLESHDHFHAKLNSKGVELLNKKLDHAFKKFGKISERELRAIELRKVKTS